MRPDCFARLQLPLGLAGAALLDAAGSSPARAFVVIDNTNNLSTTSASNLAVEDRPASPPIEPARRSETGAIFTTGAQAQGYQVSSFSALLSRNGGATNNFRISLYSIAAGLPRQVLASSSQFTLTSSAAYVTLNASQLGAISAYTLSPSTPYALVLQATNSIGRWHMHSNSYTVSDNFSVGQTTGAQGQGRPTPLAWSGFQNKLLYQLNVTSIGAGATAAPAPLPALGACAAWHASRRLRRRLRAAGGPAAAE